MTLAIMQPYFFPYIGYWQLLQVSDTFVIFDDVNFIKRGYINRNSILIGGKSTRFNLELIGSSQNKLINEIQIKGNNSKLLKTILRAYKKAPYFDVVYPILTEIVEYKENNLAKFLGNSITLISDYLKISSNIIYSSKIKKNNKLRAQNKILDICKRLSADKYINAIGGQELYDRDKFLDTGIQLNFIKTNIIEYKQFYNDFVPYLSIVDIMMFNKIKDIHKMLNSYSLV